MKMTSTKYTDEELNYFRVCKVTTHIMTDGLRTVFKQEWDNRYKATHGHWQDTAKNGSDFDGMESPKSKKRNARLLALMKNGNTKEWDCTCLFHAILYSASIGASLNPTVKKSVDELREFRNDVFAHTTDGKLTVVEFEAVINKAITSFSDLKFDTTDIEEIKNQTSFPTDELEDIKNQLEKEKKRNEEPRPFCVLPAKPSHETVYRPNEVQKVNKEMERLENTKKNGVTVLYLSGNPGCGKSEVARQVGERFFDKSTEMSLVMTLNASTIDTLLQSYVEFAGRLRCDEEMVVKISTSASLSKERKMNDLRSLIAPKVEGYSSWLMILDNVSDLKSVSKYWPQAGERTRGAGQILVTTQDSSSIPTDSYTYHLSLKEGMNLDDAISTLPRVSGSSVEESILHEVVKALDFQPLALACAAVYMQRIQSTDWTKYLEKLKEGKREATETVYKKTSSTYPATMTEAVRMAVEKEANEDEVMKCAFQFLSVIAAEPISLDYVVQYVLRCLPDEDEDLVASTVCSSSLVLSSDKEESKDIHVHQVVHSCLQIPFSRGESEVKFNIIVEVILAFPNIKNINLDDDDGFDTALSLLPHFTTFISGMHHCIKNYREAMAHSIRERGIEMIEYVLRIKSCFDMHGRHELSEVLLEILRSITEGVEDKKHPSFAEGLVGIADCLYILGRYDDELENLLKALEIQESEDGGNNRLMVDTLISLGSNLGAFPGKEKEAEQYIERALKLIEKLQLTGEDYTFLRANTLNVQGSVFESMGQQEKAYECRKKALTIIRNRNGKGRDFFSFYTLSQMGKTLRLLGQLEESKRLLQEGLAIFEQHSDFYAKHIILVNLLTQLGETSRALEQFNEAENHFKKVLDIRMNSTAFEHPSKIYILESLARCTTSLGKHEEAIHYRKKALENMNEEKHPQFANTLYDIGVSYINLNEHQEAITCLEKVLMIKTKTHGEGHEELVLTLKHLGIAYFYLEQYQKAEEFFERALENMNDEKHPQFANTLYEIGVSYIKLNEHQEAISCLEKVLMMKTKTHGEGHEELVLTLQHLGIAYFYLKQYQKAEEFFERTKIIERRLVSLDQPANLADTVFCLGVCCFKEQKYEQATRSLEEALTLMGTQHPRMSEALFFLGISHFNLGQFNQAQTNLHNSLTNEKPLDEDKQVQCLYYLGISYFAEEQHQLAVTTLERTLTEKYLEDERKAYTLYFLGISYLLQGQQQLAVTTLERTLTEEKHLDDKQVADTLYFLGVSYFAQEQHQLAVTKLERALTEEKYLDGEEVATSLYFLGRSYFEQGEYQLAVTTLERALTEGIVKYLDGEQVAYTLHVLGRSYFAQGQHQLAVTTLERTLTEEKHLDDERVAYTLYLLGRSYFTQGQHQLAVTKLERALKEEKYCDDEQVANILWVLGISYFAQGQYQPAVIKLERVLTEEKYLDGKQVAYTLYFLGISYFAQGQYQLAVIKLERVLTEEKYCDGKQMARTLYFLGISYFEQGQHQLAVTKLERTLTEEKYLDGKQVANTLYFLGISYFEQGQHQLAVTVLERALTEEKYLDDEQVANTLYFLGIS